MTKIKVEGLVVTKTCKIQINKKVQDKVRINKASKIYFKSPKIFLEQLKSDLVKVLNNNHELKKQFEKG